MQGRARRLVGGLMTTTAALALMTGAARADGGYSVKTLHFATVVGPDDDVRCDVVGDLYRPDGADAAHPAPAILTTNGFGGSKDDQRKFAIAYAKRGYVVLSYSGLGFGGSGCKISLDDRDVDGKAGSQLVTFLGGGSAATDGTRVDYVIRDRVAHDGSRRAFDPRVGMIGGSYGGEIQYAVAAIDPRVDTIVPIITWNDLAYSLAPNNTSFLRGVTSETPGLMKAEWTLGFFALGIVDGVKDAQTDPSRLVACPNFDDRACAAAAQMLATGAPNDATIAFARHASVTSYVRDIRVPTLLVQGQSDTLFNLQESVATYDALRARGTPVKLSWQFGGHSGPAAPGESDETLAKPTYQGTMYLEWFDHWLKGARRAPSMDFTFFRDWVKYDGDATPAYGRAPAYPAVGTPTDFHLSGSSSLVREGRPVAAGETTILTTALGLPTSYTEESISDPGFDPADAPGTSNAWDSAPLAQDTEVVGIPSVDLRLRAPAQGLTGQAGAPAELAFFVRLEDVGPDGKATLPHKLVAPVRVANLTGTVHVELPGIVHRFAKGHRLRLVVYGGDLAYRGGNVPGPLTLLTSPERPATLQLPIAGEGAYGPVVRAQAVKKAKKAKQRRPAHPRAHRRR